MRETPCSDRAFRTRRFASLPVRSHPLVRWTRDGVTPAQRSRRTTTEHPELRYRGFLRSRSRRYQPPELQQRRQRSDAHYGHESAQHATLEEGIPPTGARHLRRVRTPRNARHRAQSRDRSSPSAARPLTVRRPSTRSTLASGCAWRLSHHAGSSSAQPFIAMVTRFGPSLK